jgi:solute carrier family 25 (mitochondrial aspartate/glutamate transporter), member 12/13
LSDFEIVIMATALKVKEAVKESLLGTEEPTQLSAQTRSTFLLHAKKDPESGESYMGREEFINAIAPPTEDYVCSNPRPIYQKLPPPDICS